MAEHLSPSTQPRPLVFGEVLFDCFPDGQEIMGGAPFNVAWHLQGFGARPLFVSRIGEDARGARVRAAMGEWGMEDSGLQRDGRLPTGVVRVTLDGALHSFDILPDQAYDHIDRAAAVAAAHSIAPALLYHGSLITRAPAARDALAGLREASGAPAFIDINLRAPWWERARIDALMRGARWLKLNDDEIAALRPVPSDAAPGDAALEAAVRLRAELGIERVILTRGAAGASYVEDRIVSGRPPPVPVLADTIGAGDAFSAVTILGLLRGWDAQTSLERSLDFAARICGQRGATAADAALYKEYREAWGL